MDARRKSSSKLKIFEKIEYGFGCADVECTSITYKLFPNQNARNKALRKHEKDTGHKEIYRWVVEDYYETS